jgi:hypothetical protein
LGILFPYVTGGYLSVSTSSAVTAEPFVQHVNYCAVFPKDRDIVLSNDAWHVTLNLNINTYEVVLSTIKSDLNLILLHKQDFTPASELRQVETSLDNLESKLCQFKQLFPKKEPKLSLMNLGGSVLRALFGTATMADLHRLHEAMGELEDKNSEVAHYLSKQVTFIRNLNSFASLNNEALVNLSTLVKDNMLQSYGRFQETSKDIGWLNNTLQHQSELCIHIRQLEYSLMLVVQQIGELFSSVQYALLEKLPVSLINPVTLHSILTNISLNLPDNYELVAGTKFQDVHLYYELVRVALVSNAHGVQLVLSVPLKTAAQLFTLFKFLFSPCGCLPTPS